MVHLEKKTEQSAVASMDLQEPPPIPEKPRVKAMDGNNYGGNGGGKNSGGKGSQILLDGLWMQESCHWSHDLKDDKRRCFHCGSPEHMANVCPRKGGEPRPKVSKVGLESSPSSSPHRERGATMTTTTSSAPLQQRLRLFGDGADDARTASGS